MTAESAPRVTSLKLADMSERHPNQFQLDVDDTLQARIAEELDLQGLKRLRLQGMIERAGRDVWKLRAELGATATQSCVVSLAPVTTRIDTMVLRTYSRESAAGETGPAAPGAEIEMRADESFEPLTAEIDLIALATESLSLSLPDYPRAKDAELTESHFAAPGIKPMRDADAHPFAALSKLRGKESGEKDSGE